ncbi:putative exonuclease [Feldmannia species virus]|uniref:Putative exonuclease n=1 Tax=Feldmannia species virus TaxID=39420 RepID=B5LWE1_9PHYC|nr:RecE-like recombination exonuclease [Feldmannia species virus]ACH46804.1 putative exonuclease [Feldmannia species virus]
MIEYHPSVLSILSGPRIEQRTPEWFAFRRSHVTASEVSTVIAQGKGARSLLHRKKFQAVSSNFSTEFTDRGSANEGTVVEKYRELFPGVVVHHDLSITRHRDLDFVAASLDACTNTGINVEIKTSFKPRPVTTIPKSYRDQVQLQMEVADLDLTHLVYQYINIPGQPVVVHQIPRDRDWFQKHVAILRDFVHELRATDSCLFNLVKLREQMSLA